MSSILKYMQQSDANLHWGRASVDGLPFRSRSVPMMREEEFENRAVRVCDAHVATFDMSDAQQRAKYEYILDRAANNWFQVFYTQRNWDPDKKCMVVYIEWGENYIEDTRAYGTGVQV